MSGLPVKGNGVRVRDQDKRSASVPPVSKRNEHNRKPMNSVGVEALKGFRDHLRDHGLPPPAETIKDPRGNRMSINSTGNSHHPLNLGRSFSSSSSGGDVGGESSPTVRVRHTHRRLAAKAKAHRRLAAKAKARQREFLSPTAPYPTRGKMTATSSA